MSSEQGARQISYVKYLSSAELVEVPEVGLLARAWEATRKEWSRTSDVAEAAHRPRIAVGYQEHFLVAVQTILPCDNSSESNGTGAHTQTCLIVYAAQTHYMNAQSIAHHTQALLDRTVLRHTSCMMHMYEYVRGGMRLQHSS